MKRLIIVSIVIVFYTCQTLPETIKIEKLSCENCKLSILLDTAKVNKGYLQKNDSVYVYKAIKIKLTNLTSKDYYLVKLDYKNSTFVPIGLNGKYYIRYYFNEHKIKIKSRESKEVLVYLEKRIKNNEFAFEKINSSKAKKIVKSNRFKLKEIDGNVILSNDVSLNYDNIVSVHLRNSKSDKLFINYCPDKGKYKVMTSEELNKELKRRIDAGEPLAQPINCE